MYGFTLPIVLVPHTELFTAPVVAAVCWGLFSIEEIAYFIEQPFDPVRLLKIPGGMPARGHAFNVCGCRSYPGPASRLRRTALEQQQRRSTATNRSTRGVCGGFIRAVCCACGRFQNPHSPTRSTYLYLASVNFISSKSPKKTCLVALRQNVSSPCLFEMSEAEIASGFLSLFQEYRQLDLIGFSEKVARDVERITVSSSLGRKGLSPSPRLPAATAGVNGGLLTYNQLGDGTNNNGHAGGADGNHNGFEGRRWAGSGGSEVNGRSGREGSGGGKEGGPAVKPTGAERLSKSWRGNPDDDIIGG